MIFIDSACYQAEKMCEMLKSKLILTLASSAPKSLLNICMIEIPLLASNNNIRFLTQHNAFMNDDVFNYVLKNAFFSILF